MKEYTKKVLVGVSPICVILFVIAWILQGLEEAVLFISYLISTMALIFIIVKWADFVDKHVK